MCLFRYINHNNKLEFNINKRFILNSTTIKGDMYYEI
jgi:hypothetical protein